MQSSPITGMSLAVEQAIRAVGEAIEIVGIAVVVLGGLLATGMALRRLLGGAGPAHAYRRYRADLGRAILLGLEFLVAGDIVRTVALEATFANLAVLAVVVLIRTFLSFSLEVEINGHWPWEESRYRQQTGPDRL